MKVAPDRIITIIYTVASDDGRVLDQALTDAPLTFLYGRSGLIPEVEAALLGRKREDRFSLRVSREAPAPKRKQLLTLPRDMLPEGFEPRVGAALEADGDNGTFAVWIREVRDDVVVLDPNHPLSGMALNVEVEVLDVRDATPEELAAGMPRSSEIDPGRG